jgi:hypothetical protein
VVFAATVAVTVVLAALLVYTAARKLGHRPEVVRTYDRLGVPEHRLNVLALVLLAGAAGIAFGLYWAPAGIAAGIGLVLYFLLAVGAHIRAGDQRNLPTPILLVVLSVATLALRVATA